MPRAAGEAAWTGPGRVDGRSLASLVLLLVVWSVTGYDLDGIPGKHLIVSTPSTGMVWWSNNTHDISDPADVELVLDWKGNPMVPQLDMHLLIPPSVVSYPMGLALERTKSQDKHGYEVTKRFLFVADPGESCDVMHILRFPLYDELGQFSVGDKQVIMENKCVRWVTLDALGNLYATCEETGEILKLPVEQIRKDPLTAPPLVLYSSSGPNGMQVNNPGGIAVDMFQVYWSNKVMGGSTGSVVKGSSFRPAGHGKMPAVWPIAKNADLGKDYGVCLVGNNIFFTQNERVFAVSKNGGAIAEVHRGGGAENDKDAHLKLKKPRGCAWDRDGTVYVADREAGKIFSFPSLQKNLRSVGKLHRIATIEDPFAVIVVDRALSPSSVLAFALAVGSVLMVAF